MDGTWEELERKARTRRVAEGPQGKGLPHLIYPAYLERFGQLSEHGELSLSALKQLICGSSAEFAVRLFLLRDPERTAGYDRILLPAECENGEDGGGSA
ncbi:hypothetical protein BG53_01020 [Paenibacillus darwinianus]|uniref:Uncharacterized protein n=1 Tax=Paenibacillus darwinianus TaxID=1380763 RepID=A0A9W5W776_9BACL|nr:hypothetical protein [Paenibacillus darwinianus]EXX88902.1 hypothetical protein BG53_01020 [Paenibacillus darwinianus]EXX89132.1 hypothetical protein BG52_00530 [Paenibacillus darwinianus]EXX90462.1 hypothetical protein CH50_15435 [Paenibacillus darwinianus]